MTAVPIDSNVTWVPDTEQLSNRLAMVRHAMGWNMREAALACGIKAQNWREWEDGRQPRDEGKVCAQISDRTGCDFVWLMTGYIKPDVIRLLPRMSCSGGDQVSGPSSVRFRQEARRNMRLVVVTDDPECPR